MTKHNRLRWKMRPAETGLRSIGAAPRPHVYHDGKTEYATVYANGGGWQSDQNGWYYVCRIESDSPLSDGNYINTCRHPVAELDEAKRLASEWVKARLKP